MEKFEECLEELPIDIPDYLKEAIEKEMKEYETLFKITLVKSSLTNFTNSYKFNGFKERESKEYLKKKKVI